MLQSSGRDGRLPLFHRTELACLLFLLLATPLALSNHPAEVAWSGFVFIIISLAGFFLLSLLIKLSAGIRLLLSPVFGIACLTTAYEIFAHASMGAYYPYLVLALSASGTFLLIYESRHNAEWQYWSLEGYRSAFAGSIVAFGLAPLYWRSGRFSGGELVFHGPAGQDHLYHVTLLQRLFYHVPPDNFMVSGLRPTVYHYFGDLLLALVVRAQSTFHLGATDLFDLYYRCFPTLLYFLLGALAYFAGRQLVGTSRGGILGVLLLLGAGGFGWFFGLLQTGAHALHFATMKEAVFSTWTGWDGVDGIRPLVHRPAHYNSLLIVLAALNILLLPERTRRHWLVAGLLLGLMVGFNFTLAATLGAAAVFASLLLFLQRRRDAALDLAWLSLFIFIGSLPVNAGMLFSGFHNMAPGFPFRGPNLDFSTATWGVLLGRILPASLVGWASLILLPIFAYGVKLCGAGALARLDLGEERHRGLATFLGLAFAISFVIGTFFPYQGLEVGIIFLQPTLWILGLFSLRPISAWVEQNRNKWRTIALWGMLALTWGQALISFNFSCEATVAQDTARALQDLRGTSTPNDVVAYLPNTLRSKPIFGHAEESTSYVVMAMTGLDGYFSSEEYSKFNAVPGLSGKDPADILAKAQRLYEQRRGDVESFIKGDIREDGSERLADDHVRWIVVSGDALQEISSSAIPWRKTRDMAIYRLFP